MAVLERATAWEVFEQFERDVCQLGRVGGLLDWDEQVNMPPRGASARGEAKATLAGLLHERICDERFGEASPKDLERVRRLRVLVPLGVSRMRPFGWAASSMIFCCWPALTKDGR